MAKSKLLAGIELGSSKIATIIAQLQIDEVTYESSINVVGVSSVDSRGVRKGQIVDIEEAVESMIESVEAAERMAGYNLDSAFISLGGSHVQSQNSHGVVAVADPDGEINPDDVNRVIEAASAVSLPSSREPIHVIPREFIVDGEPGVKDPVGMTGVRLEVETHLVTASGAAVKNIRKAVNEVGIEVLQLVFNGMASSEAVLTKTEKELGCVLVDIGGGTTSIAVYTEGALTYSGVIPIGAKNVTNDLAIGLRVSLENAEKIKIHLSEKNKDQIEDQKENRRKEIDLSSLGVSGGKTVSQKTLTDGIMRPRLNEIFTMVRMQLESEKLLNRIPSGAIITGGGAMTIGIEDSAKKTLSLPVRIGVPKDLKGLIDDIINPAFSTATGLVMYGAKQSVGESAYPFTSKIKLPTKGIAGKIFETLKDLLP